MISHLNFVWWVGVVENRLDPLKLGRCQVRIFGYHTEDKQNLPTERLPWAHPTLPLNNPNPYAPKEGDSVVGFFMDGDEAQFPVMMGVLPGIPVRQENAAYGFNDPRTNSQLNTAPVKIGETKERYPRVLDEPTTPRVARGESVDKSQYYQKIDNSIGGSKNPNKTQNYVEPVRPFSARYPYNNVHESESGHLFELDDTPDNERINLFHKSGSYKEMYSNGDVTEKTKRIKNEIVDEDSTLYVGKNLTVIVDGDVTYQVKGDFNIQCANFSLSAESDTSLSAQKTSISSKLLNSMSSLGATTISSLGYTSLSSTGYTSVSALGPLNMSSKSIASLGAPMIHIGILGAAIPDDVKSAMSQASKNASLSVLNSGVSATITGTASSMLSPGLIVQTGLGPISGAAESVFATGPSIFSNALSTVSPFTELATSSVSSWSDLVSVVSSAADFGASGLAAVGQVTSIIADPLSAIMDISQFSALGDTLANLGINAGNAPGAEMFDAFKNSELFSGAKTLFAQGIEIYDDPTKALDYFGQAADIVFEPAFMSDMKQSIADVTSYVKDSQLVTTFGEIKGVYDKAAISLSEVRSAINPVFSGFVDSACSQYSLDLPNVAGLASAMGRVKERMTVDDTLVDSVVGIVSRGKEGGMSDIDIQSNITEFLADSFSSAVDQEMSASPITYLNLMEVS